ncbi:MAG: S8 family serine peptidase [Acidimicrobiales bacterium]
MNMMIVARRRVAIGASALMLSSLGASQLSASGESAHLTALGSPAASTVDIEIHPDVFYMDAATGHPTTTAYCEREYHIACYEPSQIQRAYDEGPLFDKGVDGMGQTIIVVDSFGSPTVGHDLSVFDKAFGLPDPPRLTIIQPDGPIPPGNHAGWAGETDLDVEYSHVMAPDASILLVETPDSETEGKTGFPAIIKAEEYVINHHLGGVISQSFSATEQSFASAQQLLSLRGAYIDAAKNHITVLTASGDSGAADVSKAGPYYDFPVTSWPDSDPLVTGVGGTELHLNADGEHIRPDSVWNDTYNVATNEFIYGNTGPNPMAGGGGRSVIFARPSYQGGVSGVVHNQRGVPDISMSAACDGGVDMYQSFSGQAPGWYVTCGTSEATPLMAGVVALADQVAGHPIGLINPALYSLSASGARGIVDVTSGDNTVTFTQKGKKHTVVGFEAQPGYDLASGVGTIDAAKFVPELARATS